jgi:hypothetical protein
MAGFLLQVSTGSKDGADAYQRAGMRYYNLALLPFDKWQPVNLHSTGKQDIVLKKYGLAQSLKVSFRASFYKKVPPI